MGTVPLRVYVDAYVARARRAQVAGQTLVDGPAAHGLLPDRDGVPLRLLVTDDAALDLLAARLPSAGAGKLKVLDAAPRCLDLVTSHPYWGRSAVSTETIMGAGDLTALPDGPLPAGLTLRGIRRRDDDATGPTTDDEASPDLVPLDDAIALVLRAEPDIPVSAAALADELRSLPAAVRLFAAVDAGGTVRATSGSAVFGIQADVLFVDTDPAWRGRGIGAAMTAAALRDATARGARIALLDATDAGAGIYRRLGFAPLGRTTRFDRFAHDRT
ncbi:GNAT family N-acetyltransferase [Patulibacter minatonensis]|uniref:GNAT family N-acetyltransferase n=1 Tax=Patulibacter minatonensis TaxID=298163 RepID=UPI0004BCFE5B|nr:GNAT family N-acetyltransferase [Patulibacter minatonensis]